jgi:hypothetical protein
MEYPIFLYVLGVLVIFLTVLLLFLWLENIIKIILGNYILWTICFATSMGIDNIISHLQSTNQSYIWLSSDILLSFFSHGQATIVLVLYILLLVLLYKKSTLSIRLPSDISIQRFLYIVFIPLALTSLILTLYILSWWVGIISPSLLESWSNNNNVLAILSHIFSLTPLWIVIHWLSTLIISVELPMRLQTDLKNFEDVI